MNITRRSFIEGIIALGVAPDVVKASSIMRVRPLIVPGWVLGPTIGPVPLEIFTGEIGEIFEFNRRRVSDDGRSHVLETWYEDSNGFLLPSGRLDEPRGEYRGTSKLWGDHV